MSRQVPEWARRLMAAEEIPPPPAPLVFFGRCTYWNDMTSFGEQMAGPVTREMPYAGRVPGELPRCPFCGSPGFQAPRDEFVRAIDTRSESDDEREAWHWQRGRQCSRSREDMITAYLTRPRRGAGDEPEG